MGLVLPTSEAYQVPQLPMVKASADKIGLGEAMHAVGPTERTSAPGTMVLGMSLDPVSGQSPLYRLAECFAPHDTALLFGKAVAPEALQDDPVGRGVERL